MADINYLRNYRFFLDTKDILSKLTEDKIREIREWL